MVRKIQLHKVLQANGDIYPPVVISLLGILPHNPIHRTFGNKSFRLIGSFLSLIPHRHTAPCCSLINAYLPIIKVAEKNIQRNLCNLYF